MVMVGIVDETTAGREHDVWHLEIFEERLPLREVIRRRVFQEVAEHNARRSGEFRGLVQPTETERELNGPRTDEHRRVDPNRQYERAVAADGRHGAFILAVRIHPAMLVGAGAIKLPLGLRRLHQSPELPRTPGVVLRDLLEHAATDDLA